MGVNIDNKTATPLLSIKYAVNVFYGPSIASLWLIFGLF